MGKKSYWRDWKTPTVVVSTLGLLVTALSLLLNWHNAPSKPLAAEADLIAMPVLKRSFVVDSPITHITVGLSNPTPANPVFDLHIGMSGLTFSLPENKIKLHLASAPVLQNHFNLGGTAAEQRLSIPTELSSQPSFAFWLRWKFKDAKGREYYQQEIYRYTFAQGLVLVDADQNAF